MALRIGKKNADNDNAPDVPPAAPNDVSPANTASATPQRKSVNPLFLVLGVLVLAALGGGAYMMLGSSPEEEESEAPPVLPRRAATSPGTAPGAPAAPGSPAPASVSNQPVSPARPAGSPPAGSVRPATAPGAAVISPQMKAQLKQLWEQGASAKHRNDYKAARAAWQKILQLRPGHPGIQDAIDKLPPR